MLQLNIILLLIISLLIYITISTLINNEVKYISVVTRQIKTFSQRRGNELLPHFGGGTLRSKKL